MLRRRLGWILVGLSLLLHIFTIYCFARQPDRFAAFTVMPIWLWGGAGLLLSTAAFYFLRAPLSLIVTAIWAVTLLAGADEARVLANFSKQTPQPGLPAPHQGKKVIRVVTLNCAMFRYGNPAADIAAWHPDIVLLQEVQPYQTRQIADALYAGRGDYRTHQTNGVVTRWKITAETRTTLRDQQVTVQLPGGGTLQVVSIHLSSAATDLRLWRKNAWTTHRANRGLRQRELVDTLNILEQSSGFPEVPAILGGDFNSPAPDVAHRLMARDFVDAFAAAGRGWGNTYQRRFPILRIDRIYVSRHFAPVRSKVVVTRQSDHRMVVADLLLK